MNKSDLVKAIAQDVEVSQEQAAKLLDAVTAHPSNKSNGIAVLLTCLNSSINRIYKLFKSRLKVVKGRTKTGASN